MPGSSIWNRLQGRSNMAFKRLPNNFGTVYKLSGNRRRPWIARRRIGEVYDDEKHYSKPVYATIGYYTTKTEALKALSAAPENLTKEDRLTFGEVYEMWKQDKYGDAGLTKSYLPAVKYIEPLFRRKLDTFRVIDIETFINDDRIPRTIKHFVKTILNQVFDYAVRHDLTDRNYAVLAKPRIDMAVQAKKTVFRHEEVEKVWKSEPSLKRDIVLILLYTGMRIGECLKLRVEDVHMDERYLVTGSKTEAGRDRIIPIHDKIYPVIAEWYGKTKGKLFHITGNPVRDYMTETWNHSPHECRHTFATQAMECGMNEEARKRILGHASVGVTNKTYTHLDIEFLKTEIAKLKY